MTDKQIAEQSMIWAKAFARRLALARHMVDELAQEAAIAILRARQSYNPKSGVSFEGYAQRGALMYMRRHVCALGGPLKNTERMPDSDSLISPEAEEGAIGVRDARTVPALSHENAEFSEALSKTDSRVALMVEAKMKGATYDEIADGLGVSRELVRRRVTAFAEGLAA